MCVADTHGGMCGHAGTFPFYFGPGAYFATTTERISRHPSSFYSRLLGRLRTLDAETRKGTAKPGLTVASELGFALERFWPLVFNNGTSC